MHTFVTMYSDLFKIYFVRSLNCWINNLFYWIYAFEVELNWYNFVLISHFGLSVCESVCVCWVNILHKYSLFSLYWTKLKFYLFGIFRSVCVTYVWMCMAFWFGTNNIENGVGFQFSFFSLSFSYRLPTRSHFRQWFSHSGFFFLLLFIYCPLVLIGIPCIQSAWVLTWNTSFFF